MFLENSRYATVNTIEVRRMDGQLLTAIRLRRLPATRGNPLVVKEFHRLDNLAQQYYNDPTQFWRIADANTELQANDLVSEPGRTILIGE